MNASKLFAATVFAAALAACSTSPVGPDYQVPRTAVINKPGAAEPFIGAADAAAPYTSAPLPAHWWRLYQDPTLDRLIERALAHNTDLRQAAANLERVQAMETETQGAAKPKLSLTGGPGYGHLSGMDVLSPNTVPVSEFNYGVSAQLSYTIDAAGQIRRAIEAAQASGEAAQAAVDLVRTQVVASTARAYAGICASGLRLQATEHSVQLQREALQVSEKLQGAGRVGQIDTARARGQLEQLQAQLPTLRAERQGGLYRLATLMGELPRDFPAELATCATPPRVTALLPVGDGAALLRRRPDIRQAERELAASSAHIGVAVADLYPKVTLGLSVDSVSTLNDFAGKDSFRWNLGPLISWTVPNTGVARARIAQAEAGQRAAFAKFDGTVLTALRETETALDAYAHELQREQSLQAARDAATTVAEQARRLYRSGKIGYLDALDAERSLAAAEGMLAASAASLADEQVSLFQALGGGWEADGDPKGLTGSKGSKGSSPSAE